MEFTLEQLAGNKLLCNFLARIRIDDETGCWEWTGAITNEGYGHMALPGNTRKRQLLSGSHRVSHELFIGSIPDGYHVDHLCRNRSCCNPAHLEAVTCQENLRRGASHKHMGTRTHCPSGHPYAGDNLYIDPTGARKCNECRRVAVRSTRAKRRAEHEARPS